MASICLTTAKPVRESKALKTTVVVSDVVEWAKSYSGPPFHAVLGDAPYHLQSIVDRFGKAGSAPAKPGTDGLFQRVSRGFMGQEWDGGDVAFRPETWDAIAKTVWPGAFHFVFGGCRTYHKMASAMEAAGMVIHPAIAWLKQHSMPKATRIDTQIDRAAGFKRKSSEEPVLSQAVAWIGHRYGGQVMKPMFEFVAVAQKPYDGKPLQNIVASGAGALSVASSSGQWPGNVILEHLPECRVVGVDERAYTINRFDDGMKPFGNGAGHPYRSHVGTETVVKWECAPGCEAGLRGRSGQFHEVGWIYEKAEFAFYQYAPKVSVAEASYGVGDKKHPTLKSIALNKWLASLLLPPASIGNRRILVPFSGIGSEMIGAMLAGWDEIVGVEIDAEYAKVAEQRIETWANHREEIMAGAEISAIVKREGKKIAKASAGQLTLEF